MGTAAVARPVKPESESKKPTVTNDGRELREAVDRVYRKYGTDLTAFYDDVKKSIIVERCAGERVSGNEISKRYGTSD